MVILNLPGHHANTRLNMTHMGIFGVVDSAKQRITTVSHALINGKVTKRQLRTQTQWVEATNGRLGDLINWSEIQLSIVSQQL
eukprot:4729301-Ditylum_brightwellii.AAC.1